MSLRVLRFALTQPQASREYSLLQYSTYVVLRTARDFVLLFVQFGNHGVDGARDEILHRRGIRQGILQQEPSFEFSTVHGQPVLFRHRVETGPVVVRT